MPLAPPAIFSILMANSEVGISPFNGDGYRKLCQAVSEAVAAWAVGQSQNVALTGAAVGIGGGGAIVPPTSRLVVPPTIPVFQAALSGAGLNGPLAVRLAESMTMGIAEAFTALAWYSGPSSSVGIGQDVSKVTTVNAPALIGILALTLPGNLVGGLASGMLAAGIGNGIAGLVILGEGTGTIAGAPVVPPLPGVGVTGPLVLI